MGTTSTKTQWHPSWWNDEFHGTAWERVKEAMERDWTQTKHELRVGGHELNQTIGDTAMQAVGKEPIPSLELANPPQVIGDWQFAEAPYGYGYAARQQFGATYPQWTPELETRLQTEWKSMSVHAPIDWETAKHLVRRGYDYDADSKTWPARSAIW